MIEVLKAFPGEFEFFQAVRLLENWCEEAASLGLSAARSPVGRGSPADSEVVRFRCAPALRFAETPWIALEELELGRAAGGEPIRTFEMIVTFFGLFGTDGVLPDHYTTLIIQRGRERDETLRGFLDIFNHRAIGLLYRAWERSRLTIDIERSWRFRRAMNLEIPSTFLTSLLAMVGLRSTHTRQARNRIPLNAWLFYGGHFARSPRNAVALELMLNDYFDLPVTVLQFTERWHSLDVDQQWSLPTSERADESVSRLGINTVVGERVREVQGCFRIRIGPLHLAQYKGLASNADSDKEGSKDMLHTIFEFVRAYVGLEFDFDIQPVLMAAEVPECRMESSDLSAAQLGRTTWLLSKTAEEDFADAAFSIDSL